MEIKDIDNIKMRMVSAGLEDLFDVLVVMPQIPVHGFTTEFVIAEYMGIKIAKLVSDGDE